MGNFALEVGWMTHTAGFIQMYIGRKQESEQENAVHEESKIVNKKIQYMNNEISHEVNTFPGPLVC